MFRQLTSTATAKPHTSAQLIKCHNMIHAKVSKLMNHLMTIVRRRKRRRTKAAALIETPFYVMYPSKSNTNNDWANSCLREKTAFRAACCCGALVPYATMTRPRIELAHIAFHFVVAKWHHLTYGGGATVQINIQNGTQDLEGTVRNVSIAAFVTVLCTKAKSPMACFHYKKRMSTLCVTSHR